MERTEREKKKGEGERGKKERHSQVCKQSITHYTQFQTVIDLITGTTVQPDYNGAENSVITTSYVTQVFVVMLV